MQIKKISEFILGDMQAVYVADECGICSLFLLPADMPLPLEKMGKEKDMQPESLAQYKIAGDIYNDGFSQGHSLRNGESVRRLRFDRQDVEKREDGLQIVTTLRDDRGYEAQHLLNYCYGREFVTMSSRFCNRTDRAVSLEMLESFSLSYLTPYLPQDAPEALELFRIRSAWSAEGRVEKRSAEELCLERSWSGHGVRCERFGQAGSMPVNGFFPFGAVHDKENHIFWGAMLMHNASWQMNFYRRDDGLSFSGGLADREFGNWMKKIGPGESFESPVAIVSCARERDFTLFCQRLTSFGRDAFLQSAPLEAELPIVFNEYCSTWGNPSQEHIQRLLEVLKGKEIAYFVIDCGWYKQEGIPWDQGMGDYEPSGALFPEGIRHTADLIREAGFVPGIWFEIENVAKYAKIYGREELLLHRDGKPLTTYGRRFLDMRRPETIEYLRRKVIDMLRENGFGYLKIDYNETIGPGVDGAESPGEGLLQNAAASVDFTRQIRDAVKDIVIENCASGGHRLEPLCMSLCSMASFSDAHECTEIPVIAANLHHVILPAQSQIWAVLRKEDSIKRIVYSLSATFLGRMCLSGDVESLSAAQWEAVDEGMAFYRSIASVIRDGRSRIFREGVTSYRHLKGWQVVVRVTERAALVVVHGFENSAGREVVVPLQGGLKRTLSERCPIATESAEGPAEKSVDGFVKELTEERAIHAVEQSAEKSVTCNAKGNEMRIYAAFPHDEIRVEEGCLHLRFAEDFEGLAVLLKKC